MIGESILVSDKPEESELLWLLRSNIFSQSHATFAHTIDKCTFGPFGIEHCVVDILNHDAESPQQDSSNQINRHDMP